MKVGVRAGEEEEEVVDDVAGPAGGMRQRSSRAMPSGGRREAGARWGTVGKKKARGGGEEVLKQPSSVTREMLLRGPGPVDRLRFRNTREASRQAGFVG